MNLQHRIIDPQQKQLSLAGKALHFAARFWFIIAVLGQWIFSYYVFNLYLVSASKGEWERWSEALPKGLVEGDPMSNTALVIHLVLAIIIMGFGPLQFVPQLRKYAKGIHRMNGKIYLVSVIVTSIAGLFMVWGPRGTVGGLTGHLAISGDAVLCLIFGFFTWRTAVQRKLVAHRKWALRLFMAASAVWFFRIGLMFWLAINGGPVGFDPETFTGPFLDVWHFGQYLLPLAILELYFWAQQKEKISVKWAVGLVIFLFTLMTAMGVGVATMGMWLPNIS